MKHTRIQIHRLMRSSPIILALALASVVGAGCQHYQPAPLSPEKSATAFDASTCYQIASGLSAAALGGQGGSASQLELQGYMAQIGRNSFTKTSEILTLAFFNNASQGTVTAECLLSWAELI